MTTAQPWLPPTALFDGALTSAVAMEVESWRARWVASPAPFSVRLNACNGSDVLPPQGWRTACGTLRLHADTRMRLRIVASALQSRRAAHASTAVDKAFLDALSEKVCRDLLDRHAELFGAAAGSQPLSPDSRADEPPALMRFCIAGPGGTLGFMTVTAGAAARARRRLARSTAQRPPLEPRRRAVTACHIRVGARVGAGRVSASDIASLAVGDVLVLDKRMVDALEVTLNGQPSDARAVEIRRSGSALFIQTTRKQAFGTA